MRVFLVAKTDSQKVFHSVCYADVAHLNHAHDAFKNVHKSKSQKWAIAFKEFPTVDEAAILL